MVEHTTISLPKGTKRDLDEQRHENESWPEFFRRITGNDLTATVDLDTDDVVNRLLEQLDSNYFDVHVTIEGDDTAMNEDDIRNIIENELDRRLEDLKRGRV